jgi:hypothetical protein
MSRARVQRSYSAAFRHIVLPAVLVFGLCNTITAQLHYEARGTGRTTGVICMLAVYNPTPTPVRTVIGDCFIPAVEDYQGYVVPQVYSVEVPPFGVVSVPLEGYCMHVQRLPVSEGGAMSDVSQWVSWAAADPLPEPGKMPGPPFYFSPEATQGDPLALTYPGSQTPFPYRIDFNRYPRQAARLLLHAAYAAGQAFDRLVAEGKMPLVSLGRPPETFKDDLIQQCLWAYGARLEGKFYDKAAFAEQFIEEVEQQLNRPASEFPAEIRLQVERQEQDLWSSISLVGSAAKRIPVSDHHPTDVFRPVPIGPPVEPAVELPHILESIDPTRRDALDRLVPVRLFLKNNDASSALQALRLAAREKWKTALRHTVGQIYPNTETALRDILTTLGHLQSDAGSDLAEDDRRAWVVELIGRLNTHVEAQVGALQTTDPDYLQKWRFLKSWEKAPWYADYCASAHPLKKLADTPATVRNTRPFSPSHIRLTGASWKHTFASVTGAVPRKFPWWLPAGGIPVIGAVTYLIMRDEGGSASTPAPTAVPDALSLPCRGEGTLNVLANDTGDGIAVTAVFSDIPEILVAISGATSVVIASTSTVGVFTATYTITDRVGRTATGTIRITVEDRVPPTVVCPRAVTLDGCGQAPAPALTGQATAIDDCAGLVSLTFTDHPPVLTGCSGTVRRIWTATDAGGNTATCTQNITVEDRLAPVFTSCPSAVTVSCEARNNLAVTGMAQAQDACNGVSPPVHTDNTMGFNGCSGVIIRTFMTADSCGNTATCQQTLSVVDNTPPVFTTCPGPVSVRCGQQNNLNVTGRAVASDACSGPMTVTHTDDLSKFSACEGVIIRTFVAEDPCGNTATCRQAVVVLPVPCDFTPSFAFEPAVCGDCNGVVRTKVAPPGSYTYVWETGNIDPEVSGLCPGPISVTITDTGKECANVFTPVVPNVSMLTLTVLQVVHSSVPSSNNGRVVLQVTLPNARPPFLVFVNGAPIGAANTFVFQITNMPRGEYLIWVVDRNGQGCLSNQVLVILLPGLRTSPQLNQQLGSAPLILSAATSPEHPAPTPLLLRPAGPGFALNVPTGPEGQLQVEYHPWLLADSDARWVAPAAQLSAGYRRYQSRPSHPTQLFAETLLTRLHLPPFVGPSLYGLTAGGGVRGAPIRGLTLEAGVRLQLLTAPSPYGWSVTAYVRTHLPTGEQPTTAVPAIPFALR